MKWLCLLALVGTSLTLFAQSEGETKSIDGQNFTYQKGIWVHSDLGANYTVTEEFTAVHKSKKWNKWYTTGSPTLQKIMNLGPNVVFKFKGSDGQFHVYSVFANKKLVKAAVAGGSAAIATGLGGSAAGAVAAAGAGAAAGGAAASGTILGVSAGTAAAIGGAVVAGAVVVENNNDDDEASAAKR